MIKKSVKVVCLWLNKLYHMYHKKKKERKENSKVKAQNLSGTKPTSVLP